MGKVVNGVTGGLVASCRRRPFHLLNNSINLTTRELNRVQGLVDGEQERYGTLRNHVGESAPPEAKGAYSVKALFFKKKLYQVALCPVQLPCCQVNTVVQQMD